MPRFISPAIAKFLTLCILSSSAACVQGGAPQDGDDEMPGTDATNQSARSVTLGPGLQRLADIAISDLAARLQVATGEIDVVEAAYVTWRDSSAGCPRPGMQYMHVLTNGARLVLRANDVLYHYHSGGDRPPFYCASPSPEGPAPYEPGEA